MQHLKKFYARSEEHLKFISFRNTLILFLIFSFSAFAQEKGSITGLVIDGDFGEGMIGANVFIETTSLGAATDIEGRYTIKAVPAGTYTVVFSMIGYAKKSVTGVVVEPGQVVKLDITMNMESIQTEEVVVTAKAVQNSEAGLLIKRQKSIQVSDAISAEQFSRSGSGNAAEAVKQIVGASVVEGKEVYVRGLGDRYTSTQLNGAEIPSVDPYKRSGSVDIIPSSLIENIQAVKSFTPDKPGDFSGGAVDVTTKNFPEKLTFNFSASSTYNSESTGNGDMLEVISSDTDFLGYDDGSRDIPGIAGNFLELSKEFNKDSVARANNDAVKAFNNTKFGPFTNGAPLNQSYSLSIGNQVDVFDRPFGFIASLTYKNGVSGYTNGQYSRWERAVKDTSKRQLDMLKNFNEKSTSHDVLWGAILKGSYKLTPNHILSVNGLFNQNGESFAKELSGEFPYSSTGLWSVNNTGYKDRSLYSVQMEGQHFLKDLLDVKIEWQGSFLESNQDEPDLRYFYMSRTYKYDDFDNIIDTNYSVQTTENPERFYRYTKENQRSAKLDITIPFNFLTDAKSSLKVGGFFQNKRRDFLERTFSYENFAQTFSVVMDTMNGNIERYFDEYTGLLGQDTIRFGGFERVNNIMGVYIQELDKSKSNYSGNRDINATYAMFDLPLLDNLRLITGARYEETRMKVFNEEPDSTAEVNTSDILPSVNMIYNVIEDVNVRASFGKTLARPTYREIASFFENRDFNGGDVFVGNRNLKRTLVDNYDLRFEYFTGPGEIIAVSGFYKKFVDPIVLQITDFNNSTVKLKWNNVNEAIVYGVEFELRERLDLLTEMLSDFTFGGNVSFITSEVKIPEQELNLLRLYDPGADDVRPFHGQSPYLINLNLNYDNYDYGLNASLFYNVFGERLIAVGFSGAPDVYEQPFHLLNFSLSKTIIDNISAKVSITNLLNSKEEKTQEFLGTTYTYEAATKGTSISLGVKYSL
ncbi:MAG: outer membrane protein [Melioribacteraceae bacterium]|nr:MAG: outer membrane protein [Melioribacteraceae bacterium]